MVNTLHKAMHPSDAQYRANRMHILRELSTQSDAALKQQLDYLATQAPPEDDQNVGPTMLHNIRRLRVPKRLKGILDSTSGTTGNVIIRQDLEPIIHLLFVRQFPLWETIQKAQSNGLTLLAPLAA